MCEDIMEITNRKIEELVPYENNPRHNDNAVEYVANSIREFGFRVPIIIDTNDAVVAGHTRLKACEKLGIDEVPCIVADDLTEEQIKAFRLVDNKVTEFSAWDRKLLETELASVGIDMSLFGFLPHDGLDEIIVPDDLDFEDKGKEYTCSHCGGHFRVKNGEVIAC